MFSETLSRFDLPRSYQETQQATEDDVLNVLKKPSACLEDLPVLLSPAAEKHLDKMAFLSEQITRRRFGNIIQFYIPLYLSNKCSNACIYCGFRNVNPIERRTLKMEEALAEAGLLHDLGFRNILLVSGSTQDILKEDYLEKIVLELSRKFTSVSMEVESLEQDLYQKLAQANLDGVTLYQETYDREIYSHVHPAGKKRDYDFRLNAMDRVGMAGIRKLGIGVLLGLNDFRKDALVLGLHCKYLMTRYWKSSISVSFPRIRENESSYKADFPVSDKNLGQMIFAFRIVFPDIDLVLSTREPPSLRNGLANFGITFMSAGSRTNPGGYSRDSSAGKQFEMEDTRPVEEIIRALKEKNLDIVWKDWNAYA